MIVDLPYLVLIKNSIEQIFLYLEGKDRDAFLSDDLLRDGCLSRLIVIGEYSIRVSQATKDSFPEVEWQQMKVARNFYVHAYGQLNWELIWDTIQLYLPGLKSKIENIISIVEKDEV